MKQFDLNDIKREYDNLRLQAQEYRKQYDRIVANDGHTASGACHRVQLQGQDGGGVPSVEACAVAAGAVHRCTEKDDRWS